ESWKPPVKVTRWRNIVDKWACEIGVSQALIFAVIQMESGGNEKAYRYEPGYYRRYIEKNLDWKFLMMKHGYTPRDVAASYGLMQLMFPTAYPYKKNLTPAELYEPDTNVRIGTAYLAGLLKKYDGDKLQTLAHYNGGAGGARAVRLGKDTQATRYAKATYGLYERYKKHHMEGAGA
ncbi:MAG: transglycosylase SLT domain-containing protein, partial [Clostridia bacterium]|nr:transglycosylase SLT domain-containing protein [Clostridia bacterium]